MNFRGKFPNLGKVGLIYVKTDVGKIPIYGVAIDASGNRVSEIEQDVLPREDLFPMLYELYASGIILPVLVYCEDSLLNTLIFIPSKRKIVHASKRNVEKLDLLDLYDIFYHYTPIKIIDNVGEKLFLHVADYLLNEHYYLASRELMKNMFTILLSSSRPSTSIRHSEFLSRRTSELRHICFSYRLNDLSIRFINVGNILLLVESTRSPLLSLPVNLCHLYVPILRGAVANLDEAEHRLLPTLLKACERVRLVFARDVNLLSSLDKLPRLIEAINMNLLVPCYGGLINYLSKMFNIDLNDLRNMSFSIKIIDELPLYKPLIRGQVNSEFSHREILGEMFNKAMQVIGDIESKLKRNVSLNRLRKYVNKHGDEDLYVTVLYYSKPVEVGDKVLIPLFGFVLTCRYYMDNEYEIYLIEKILPTLLVSSRRICEEKGLDFILQVFESSLLGEISG